MPRFTVTYRYAKATDHVNGYAAPQEIEEIEADTIDAVADGVYERMKNPAISLRRGETLVLIPTAQIVKVEINPLLEAVPRRTPAARDGGLRPL